MKKWKVIFISIAIVVGIGGAYASYKQDGICSFYIQYHYTGGVYVPAGEEDVDYACIGSAGVCTYYKPSISSPYLPCHFGTFTPITELNAKKK